MTWYEWAAVAVAGYIAVGFAVAVGDTVFWNGVVKSLGHRPPSPYIYSLRDAVHELFGYRGFFDALLWPAFVAVVLFVFLLPGPINIIRGIPIVRGLAKSYRVKASGYKMIDRGWTDERRGRP